MAISELKAIVAAIFSSYKTICTQFGKKIHQIKISFIFFSASSKMIPPPPSEETIAFGAETNFEVIFKQERYKINLNETVCC